MRHTWWSAPAVLRAIGDDYIPYRCPGLVISNYMPASVFDPATLRRRRARSVEVAAVLARWITRENGTVAATAFAQVIRHVPHARPMLFGMSHEENGPAQLWARTHCSEEDISFTRPIPRRELVRHFDSELDALSTRRARSRKRRRCSKPWHSTHR